MPAHGWLTESVDGVGSDGTIIRCHAGCAVESVLAALGQSLADLFEDEQRSPRCTSRRRHVFHLRGGSWSVRPPWRHVRVHYEPLRAGTSLATTTRTKARAFRPISRCDTGWILKDPSGPLTDFLSPRRRPRPRRRGRRLRRTARELGLVATTSPHGTKSAARATGALAESASPSSGPGRRAATRRRWPRSCSA